MMNYYLLWVLLLLVLLFLFLLFLLLLRDDDEIVWIWNTLAFYACGNFSLTCLLVVLAVRWQFHQQQYCSPALGRPDHTDATALFFVFCGPDYLLSRLAVALLGICKRFVVVFEVWGKFGFMRMSLSFCRSMLGDICCCSPSLN